MEDNRDRMTDRLEVEVRRSPKYSMFIAAGVLVGFLVAGVLVLLPADTSQLTAEYSRGAALGILMMILGVLGAALGGTVALIADRRNAKRARTYTVQAEYVARRRTAAQETEAAAEAEPTGQPDSAPAVEAAPAEATRTSAGEHPRAPSGGPSAGGADSAPGGTADSAATAPRDVEQ
ncbi:MFS transporter [Brevibacterium album]|uniref:MFS transporter n=1 Tax=Brevibacterium album TaxID=417948 RepID=UPI000687DEE2|nr:MFS transporter [Brevibacterium album]